GLAYGTSLTFVAVVAGVTYFETRRPPKEPFSIPEPINYRLPLPKAGEKPKEDKKKEKPQAKTRATHPLNVLWIAVDSLRSDMISDADTPNLAALLRESVYYPNTIVPVPRTGPSWAAALTSLDPIMTGVETMFPDEKRADLSTLALPAYLATNGW